MTFQELYAKELRNTSESTKILLERLEDGDEMGYLEVALDGTIRQATEMKGMIIARRRGAG